VRPAPRGVECNRDLIPGFQRVPRPATPDEPAWTGRLATPMCNVALVVFHIEIDLNMRIGERKFRHGRFQGDGVL
jgi:hypothetical protein